MKVKTKKKDTFSPANISQDQKKNTDTPSNAQHYIYSLLAL